MSWQKIVDYEGRIEDTGLYVYEGQLQFYPEDPGEVFDPETYHHVVLTRSSDTDVVAGYVDGREAFHFTDVGEIADIDNADDLLHFFVDDVFTRYIEVSAGRIASLAFTTNRCRLPRYAR